MKVVIKYGGNAMTDRDERLALASAIRQAAHDGLGPVVVHGGGPFIARELEAEGIPHRFVRGLRVTTDGAMPVVERALTLLGKQLAQEIGGAVSLTGRDAGLLQAETFSQELGLVGEMTGVNSRLLEGLLSLSVIPVIASLALDSTGRLLNVNADEVAGAAAAALDAPVVFLTDVPGVFDDPADPASLVPRLSRSDARARIADGRISGGMIPKVEAALAALAGGAPAAVIADGRDRAAFLEVLQSRAGTVFTGD